MPARTDTGSGSRARASRPGGRETPRYLRVAQALQREIERGRYPVGTMLPTEIEICERFAVSRYTAREAIRRLVDSGLVVRRAGVGTTVTANRARARFTANVSDLAELMEFNRRAQIEIDDEERVTVCGELARVLPGAEGQRWLRFSGRRFGDGSDEPIVHTEILVHPMCEAIRAKIRRPGALVWRLIEQVCGERVVELRQEIGAIATPRRIAARLGTRAGAPALRVLRYYLGSAGTVLSVAINTYPAERFSLTTSWQLETPNAHAHAHGTRAARRG